MSSQHTSDPATQTTSRGPERFVRPEVERDRPSWPKALGSGLALLALVVGIPALLLLLPGGQPVPTGVPSRDGLSQPLSVDALLVVLKAVVWLAWLQFVVCTAVELLSLLRGGGLPRPVPLSGPTQALARALVGAVLVGTTLLGSTGVANAVTAEPVTPGAAATSQTAVDQGTRADSVTSDRGDRAEGTDDARASADRGDEGGAREMMHMPGVPSDMSDVIGKKVAIVQPPSGHYHDNLWDIAERHLDDGRRWKEIFELNKDREQPDGQQLVLGRLIQPGWVLIMPDDATGVQRVQPAPQGVRDGGGGGARESSESAAPGSAAVQGADALDTGGDQSVDSSSNAATFLGGGLLAAVLAGALLAERRRRRSVEPDDAESETEVALRVGADDDRITWLDQALRGLSATCRAERLTLPQVYAASVSDEHIDLRIAPPAESAPAPWSVLDDGRRWRLDRTAEQPDATGHAPYPGLVCLGRDDDGADLLVDLESVGSIVSITGSHTIAREVVSALAVQLATVPWADAQVVRSYQLSSSLAAVAGSPLVQVDDLSGLLESWGARSPRRNAVDVLSGRLGRRPGAEPEYLVMGDAPTDDDTQSRLSTLASAGSRGVGVVAAVALAGARWRLRVDDTGRLTIPLLDTEVQAVRLPAGDAEQLGGLFAKAREDDTGAVSAGRVAVPEPPRPGEDGEWRLAEVAVGVLGGIDVRAAGGLDPSRLELATEIAVFLALQSAPVHPSVVAASVWPRGVTPEVRDATIARVREWLGTDADGNHVLRETPEGRLHLSDDVAVDWHAFCALARRARAAQGSDERELLRRALRLVRGEVLAHRPSGRYSWVPRTRLEHRCVDVVVDTAHRLAELTVDDDPDGAAAASRAGLRLAPTSQVLWRDLLLAESRNPDGPGTASVVEDMLQTLEAVRATPEAETDALVVELLPEHVGGGDTGRTA